MLSPVAQMTKPEMRILSREPWWAHPPQQGQTEADVEWGYLVVYEDGAVEFTLDERPAAEEIHSRKGCR